MNVRTQDGLLTNLAWWGALRVNDVDKDTIEATSVPRKALEQAQEKGLPLPDEHVLVLAKLPGQPEATSDLFKALQAGVKAHNEAVRTGLKDNDVFDFQEWTAVGE